MGSLRLATVLVLVFVLVATCCAPARTVVAAVAVAVAVAAVAVIAAAVCCRMPTSGDAPIKSGGGEKRPLVKFHGELLTPKEVAAVKAVTKKRLPMKSLPVTVADLKWLPYRKDSINCRFAHHNGQRKLLLGEVDFLTRTSRDGDVVVYAGSAPGTHITFLAGLFPAVRFELHDPREFAPALLEHPAVKTVRGYFDDEIAKSYAGRDDVLFVSDIRTGTDDTEAPSPAVVASDMAMQERWVLLMEPRASMLKFRLPWSEEPVEYLDGDIHLQAWAPPASTETRLISVRPFNRVSYLAKGYDERLVYFKTAIREWATFDHGVSTAKVRGLDHCYDCALEAHIWSAYLERAADKSRTAADLFNATSRELRRTLDVAPHGVRPDALMVDKREDLHPIACALVNKKLASRRGR